MPGNMTDPPEPPDPYSRACRACRNGYCEDCHTLSLYCSCCQAEDDA